MKPLALLLVLALSSSSEEKKKPHEGMLLEEFDRLWPKEKHKPLKVARQVVNLRYLEQRVYGDPLNCRIEIDFPSGKKPVLRSVRPLD